MLNVKARRAARVSWRKAKVALVARSRVGVAPGVKTESQRFVRKSAMVGKGGEEEGGGGQLWRRLEMARRVAIVDCGELWWGLIRIRDEE
jgi:hypothetical protein